jgi:hypothetical protein
VRVYTVRRAVHYRACGRVHPCKANVGPGHPKRFTTDVRRVTCPHCLAWLARTASAQLDGWRRAQTV